MLAGIAFANAPEQDMDSILKDVRYGIRVLFKNPGFTAITVIALALGIGTTSAVFSIANALLLNPFPFENLDRLVMVREIMPNQGLKAVAVSPGDFADWQKQNDVFQGIAGYRIRDISVTGAGGPELVRGSFVSSDFFSILNAVPIRGRAFLPDEDQPGREQVVMIGYGLWQRRFAADPRIVGRTITLNDRAFSIVGVLSPQFDFPFGSELWMPLALTTDQKNIRDVRNLYVLAHLKPDTTVSQSQAEMAAIARRIERVHPKTNAGINVRVVALKDQQAEFTRPMLAVLAGMAVFLLLLACANVANLLFARATTRQKEIAIRVSLSAGRWRVIRQLLIESLLLSGMAGTLGLLISIWSADLIKASLPPDVAKFMAGWSEIGVDARVLLFTLGVSICTTIIFGLVPAMHSARLPLNDILKEGGTSGGISRYANRARKILAVSEIAFALVLLVGSGLMVKGFWHLFNVFNDTHPESVLTMQTSLPETKYKEPRRMMEFYKESLGGMQTLPGVQLACIASNTPMNNSPNPVIELRLEGRPVVRAGERQLSDLIIVGPNYFRIIGAKLLSGRDFNDGDGLDSPRVAIISEQTARRYWPGENPLGKRVQRSGSTDDKEWLTVVGIVSDIKQSWFDKEIRPQLFLPYLQAPRAKMYFLLRTSVNPLSLTSAARLHINKVDKNQPVEEIKTLKQLYRDETSPLRFAAVLMLVIGAIALVLSAVGVYGVLSYSVAQRTHEIGIRSALGAKRTDVLRLILTDGLKIAAVGLAIGLPLALALGRIMASVLFGVVALEYEVLISFVLVLSGTALLSSYIPALRAAGLNPIVALRHQ